MIELGEGESDRKASCLALWEGQDTGKGALLLEPKQTRDSGGPGRLVQCLLSVLALCRGEGATTKTGTCHTPKRGRYVFGLIILLTFLHLSLLPLTSPYISLPHSPFVSFPGTSESSQHPTTLLKALIIKPTCPAALRPHSGHLDLSP